MIDPRRLGVLQAVAVHGSVAGAAGALHLTPPAVSQLARPSPPRPRPLSLTPSPMPHKRCSKHPEHLSA